MAELCQRVFGSLGMPAEWALTVVAQPFHAKTYAANNHACAWCVLLVEC